MALDDQIKSRLLKEKTELLENGELITVERLNECYALFRSRFGPDRLGRLDGEELLNTMHLHGSQDSLVYWIEFKEDEEFPGIFGSIAGGSALKFGIYKRKETGVWMTGSAQNQIELTIAEAIQVARKHRDQILAGSELLQAFPQNGSDADYLTLQRALNARAPDVSNSAWGHKYFSLVYPDKVDSYHVEDFQRFHLIKLLQMPPADQGRYVAAGRYVEIAAELSVPLNHLGKILNHANGRPYRTWRIGTRLGGEDSIWPFMRDTGCIAVGWDALGDLSWVERSQDHKSRLRTLVQDEYYSNDANTASRKAGEIFNFIAAIQDGDLALAADGQQILGIGRVTGGYIYDAAANTGAPHQRPVDWLNISDWKLPTGEGLRTTVFQVRKQPENLIQVERKLLSATPVAQITARAPSKEPEQLTGVPGQVQGILERKGQVILYGPPGTGKTYWARSAAFDLASLAAFKKRYELLGPAERTVVDGDDAHRGLVRFCTFHPGYGYEDFLEGYRPHSNSDGQLIFERRSGIFKQLCADAAGEPEKNFYLIVDEINRGDIPRIFGELITLLEADKRGLRLLLPLSGERFSVPKNVYIVGTMNTADRSIALLDTALRRRFGFVELLPQPMLLSDAVVAGSIPLGPWLSAINDKIRQHVGRDARNLQIGHAYLLHKGRPITDLAHFSRVLLEDIIPLLEEYCYEDYDTLEKVLGSGLIDKDRQRVREELFSPSRSQDLIQAILSPHPELATLGEVISATNADEINGEDSQEDESVA